MPSGENYSVPANLTESFQQQLNPGSPHCQNTLHRDEKFQGGSGELHIMHHIKESVAANDLSTVLILNGSTFIVKV